MGQAKSFCGAFDLRSQRRLRAGSARGGRAKQDKVSSVQANRVWQYARAAGILAKTDKVDARVLCAFGSAMQPEPTPPLSAQQKRLRELETQRQHLSRMS